MNHQVNDKEQGQQATQITWLILGMPIHIEVFRDGSVAVEGKVVHQAEKKAHIYTKPTLG